jgi:hypothetical protein
MNTFRNQTEQSKNLLNYFISKKIEALKNKTSIDKWEILIEMSTLHLLNLLNKEIEYFFTCDIESLSSSYKSSKDIKQQNVKKELKDLVGQLGLIPVDTDSKTLKDKILVIDINYLPSEYKDESVDAIRESLEAIYGCKVLLIDGSRRNLEGIQINNSPVYFI